MCVCVLSKRKSLIKLIAAQMELLRKIGFGHEFCAPILLVNGPPVKQNIFAWFLQVLFTRVYCIYLCVCVFKMTDGNY